MKEYLFTFVEYRRNGGVYLSERTGQAMEVRANTPLHAAQRIARGFLELGQSAEVFPNGPTVYPHGAAESEFCWQLLETREDNTESNSRIDWQRWAD
jgi:hypothetical protein